MFQAILTAAFILLAIYIVWTLVQGYREAIGTVWERLVAAARGSATVLWARIVMFAGAMIPLIIEAADLVNAPGVSDAIRGVMKPDYVSLFTIGVMLVTEFARRRTLPLVP